MIISHQVHSQIQLMSTGLTASENVIATTTIADCMHMQPDELAEHLNILHDLFYLDFSGLANDKICLTYNGLNTLVPKDYTA